LIATKRLHQTADGRNFKQRKTRRRQGRFELFLGKIVQGLEKTQKFRGDFFVVAISQHRYLELAMQHQDLIARVHLVLACQKHILNDCLMDGMGQAQGIGIAVANARIGQEVCRFVERKILKIALAEPQSQLQIKPY
jgi:hypothetical protein